MKQLEIEFDGTGEVKGFHFKQIRANDYAYLYEVTFVETDKKHYEVFKKVINTQFDNISYPKSKSFGLWAWTIMSFEKALEKFELLTKKLEISEQLKLQEQE